MRKTTCYELQVVGQVIPPATKILILFRDTIPELSFPSLSQWVIYMYDYLIQDLGEATHFHETRRRMSLHGGILSALWKGNSVRIPTLDLGSVVH